MRIISILFRMIKEPKNEKDKTALFLFWIGVIIAVGFARVIGHSSHHNTKL